METPKVETPAIQTPVVETPKVEAPVEAPKVETPVTPEAPAEEVSLMDGAIGSEKEVQATEEKRLLDTPDEKLSAEDLPKKQELLKVKAEAEKLAKANVVPEKYAFKVPEGMTLDQEYADKASVIMKKHGITQAAATELGEMAAAQIQKITAEKVKQDEANFKSFLEDLKKETIAELSKDGVNAQKELSFAAKSRDRLASPGLIDKLNKSGLANDIDVIKLFISIGKLISEGKIIEGVSIGAGEKDPLAVLYPKTPPKK